MDRTIFDEEHEMFRKAYRTFLEREMVPHRDEWTAAEIVPRSVFATAGQSGFLAMPVPEQFGGAGMEDFRYSLVVVEELCAADLLPHGLGMTLHTDVCLPYFLEYTNSEQQERWLPGIASGDLITAVAMTEPGIGSDLASMTTTAVRDGDTYVINGSKTFITNGINADLVLVAAKTDPTQKHNGISIIVVERGMEGFERGRNLEKVGMHAQDTAELFFTDVRVPVANRIREEGEGFLLLVKNLPQERLSIAMTGVAHARIRAGVASIQRSRAISPHSSRRHSRAVIFGRFSSIVSRRPFGSNSRDREYAARRASTTYPSATTMRRRAAR